MQVMSDTFPRSVDEIFEDFTKRRQGLLKALTDGGLRLLRRSCLRAHRRLASSFVPPTYLIHPLCLIADVEDFFQQCDPERENLSLYGESY